MHKRLAWLLPLLFYSAAALAEFSFPYDFDAHKKQWHEAQVSLPAAPKKSNLVEFPVSPTAPHHYFLDRASISSDSDGVVRYTVVIHTAGGSVDVDYEGMRCDGAARKIYAFGQPNGSWTRNRYADWEPIHLHQANGYRRELFQHYLCTPDGPADLKTIRRALSIGGINRGGDSLIP